MNPLDPVLVATILAFGGIGVTGITEMLKRLFKASGFWAYVISLAVSAGATAFILVQASAFALSPFLLYTIVVFLEANGIYKVVAKPSIQ